MLSFFFIFLLSVRYAVAAGSTHQQVVRQLQRWGVPLLPATTSRLGFFVSANGYTGETEEDGEDQIQTAEL